jgi:hypothetical protein
MRPFLKTAGGRAVTDADVELLLGAGTGCRCRFVLEEG